jgi:hypothetical protein
MKPILIILSLSSLVLYSSAQEKEAKGPAGPQKHRNIVANSDFSFGEVGRIPPEWKAEAEIPVKDATIVAEDPVKFLRFRRVQVLRRANLLPNKEVIIPEKARSVEFSVRLRVNDLVPGKGFDIFPGAHVTGRDAQGEEVCGAWVVVKRNTSWRRYSVRFQLKPGAKTLRIAIGPFGSAGVFDVDDMEVEFE